MAKVEIDPFAITVVRTSVQRLLRERGAEAKRPFVTAADLPAYWREVTMLYGRDDLALRIASELPIGGWGRTSYAFMSAATIGDALRVFCRDAQARVDGMTATLGVARERAILRLEGPRLLHPIFEVLLGLLALRCRQLAEPPVPIRAVGVPRDVPADPGPWTALFTVKPKFGHRAYLEIDAALLGRAMRTADATVREALGTGPQDRVTDQVRAHVRAWVRDNPATARVARALGMSMRTLQRRLGEEGSTFRQLALDTKVEVARQLLARDDLSITQIAAAVGFAGVPAFSAAFAQQTRTTPSQFRKQVAPNAKLSTRRSRK